MTIMKSTPAHSTMNGVTYCNRAGRWLARVSKGGKRFHLGYYATFMEARAVRLAANKLLNLPHSTNDTGRHTLWIE